MCICCTVSSSGDKNQSSAVPSLLSQPSLSAFSARDDRTESTRPASKGFSHVSSGRQFQVFHNIMLFTTNITMDSFVRQFCADLRGR